MPTALHDYIQIARQMQIIRSPRDEKLTRRRLVCAREEILKLARHHRRKADEYFRRMQKSPADDEFQIEPSRRRPYPLGCCRQIRDHAWPGLSNEPLIRSLRKEGLTWGKIYFIEEGRWFQNAIQCGDWILDVAHDTVNESDTPVICYSLEENKWENLDDWLRFAEVASAYYHMEVYPNLYFPLLFPMIPFLAVRETGRLDLLYCQQMLFFLDLGDDWRRIAVLLDDRNMMSRSLPPVLEKRLAEAAADAVDPFPVELRKCAPAELRQELREWDRLRDLPGPQIAATFRNYEKLARQTARRLRLADIRA